METLKKLFAPITGTIDYIQNHFKAMLFLLLLFLLFFPSQKEHLVPYNLQSVTLTGSIIDTTEIVKTLDKARENDEVKGVLLIVDSHGGAYICYLEVWVLF
jgi:protease-4